jgi:hypothetical protein
MNQPNKLDYCITQLEKLTSDKYSNLLGQLLSCEENEVLWIHNLASNFPASNTRQVWRMLISNNHSNLEAQSINQS